MSSRTTITAQEWARSSAEGISLSMRKYRLESLEFLRSLPPPPPPRFDRKGWSRWLMAEVFPRLKRSEGKT